MDDKPKDEEKEKKRKQSYKLYTYLFIGHTLSNVGERSWEFAVALFLINILPTTLAGVASFGLMVTVGQFISGPFVGGWVSRTKRLFAIRLSVIVQTLSVALAAGGTVILLSKNIIRDINFLTWGTEDQIAIICVYFFGILGGIASQARRIALEMDWVVVICKSDEKELSSVNSIMRSIDLGCKVSAPVVVGFIIQLVGIMYGAIVICAWNTVSGFFEICMLSGVYYMDENLQIPKKQREDVAEDHHTISWCNDLFNGWKVYSTSKVFWAELSLALLYMNLLTWHDVMVAYLNSKGMVAGTISLVRGVGEAMGLFGAFLFRLLVNYMEAKTVGMIAIWLQAITLLIGVVGSVYLFQNPYDLVCLCGGLILSRVGLWMFDLSVSTQTQQLIPEENRGLNAGVQETMQNLFQLFPYVATIIFSGLNTFPTLMLVSEGTVMLAAIFYLFHSCVMRNAKVIDEDDKKKGLVANSCI